MERAARIIEMMQINEGRDGEAQAADGFGVVLQSLGKQRQGRLGLFRSSCVLGAYGHP